MTQRSALFASIEDAVAAIGRGEVVVVVDDEDRENEGDLIMAAEFATPERIAFFVRHTSGVICVPLTGERCDELGLAAHGRAQHRVAPHRVHRHRRLPPRHHDGHLRHGPRAHDPCADRPGDPSRRPGSPRSHLPAALPPGWRAEARRSHRGVGRPRPPRRPLPGGRAVRDRERRRIDGAGARPRTLLRRARPADDLDRRPHPLSPPHREARAPRGRGPHPDGVG